MQSDTSAIYGQQSKLILKLSQIHLFWRSFHEMKYSNEQLHTVDNSLN